jgi:hypothetical protein
MSEEDNYSPLKIVEDQPAQMIVHSLCDVSDGLKIYLSSELSSNHKMLEVVFDPYVAYRNMNESYRMATLSKYPDGLKETIYKVNNSAWVKWFHEESMGMYIENNIIHYAFMTIADCIDVLAEFEPKASWIDKI